MSNSNTAYAQTEDQTVTQTVKEMDMKTSNTQLSTELNANQISLSFDIGKLAQCLTGESEPDSSHKDYEHAFEALKEAPEFANILIERKIKSWDAARGEYADCFVLALEAEKFKESVLKLAKALHIKYDQNVPDLIDVVAKLAKGWRSTKSNKWEIEPTAFAVSKTSSVQRLLKIRLLTAPALSNG